MNHRFFALCAAVVTLCVGACNGGSNAEGGGDAAADTNVIRIGQFASLTGTEATFGQQVSNGAKLAVEEINAAGGVLGKKIELITEDTESKPQATKNAVEKLLSKDRVIALVGEVASGRTLIAAPLATREKVPLLTPASTNEKVTMDESGNVRDWVFRICFIDPFQAQVMARFAAENLGLKQVAILKANANPYSVGLAENFAATFRSLGGTIVEEQGYEERQVDFKAQLTAIKAKNPQAIFVPGYYNEVSLIATQARELGITAPLLGGDGWDSPELTKGAAGKALEGSYFSNHYSESDSSAIVQSFVQNYSRTYNEAPGAMSALGYDAMKIVARTIADAGTASPQAIRDGLAKLSGYNGVTGTISINEKHNATKPAVVLQIRDGKFAYHTTINP